MKKNLRLFFVAVLAMVMGSVSAQEVVFDFTDEANPWGLPTDQLKETGTFTKDGKSIVITTTNYTRWFADTKALLIGKKDATLTLPAFDFDVERIEVIGHANASGKVTQNIFVGDEAVSTEVTGAKSTAVFDIATAKQAAGTIYVIKVTNDNNDQITKINVWKKGTAQEVTVPEAANIAAFTAMGNGAEAALKLDGAKVTFVSADGKYVYVRDATGGMCFYNQSAMAGATNKWQLGGKVEGKVSIYNGMTQMTVTDAAAMTHTDGAEYQPVEIALAAAKDHVADLVKITDKITVVLDNNKFYTDADKSLQIYDNFKLKYTIAEGDVLEGLTGVVIPYNAQLEIAPIANVLAGISDIKADAADAPVYNLGGQRVAAAKKGIYIRNGKKYIVK